MLALAWKTGCDRVPIASALCYSGISLPGCLTGARLGRNINSCHYFKYPKTPARLSRLHHVGPMFSYVPNKHPPS